MTLGSMYLPYTILNYMEPLGVPSEPNDCCKHEVEKPILVVLGERLAWLQESLRMLCAGVACVGATISTEAHGSSLTCGPRLLVLVTCSASRFNPVKEHA